MVKRMQTIHTANTSIPERAQSPASLTLHVRVPSELLAKVDRLVGTRYLGRGEAVRGLLSAGLKSEEAGR
jgi:hypothetical protein